MGYTGVKARGLRRTSPIAAAASPLPAERELRHPPPAGQGEVLRRRLPDRERPRGKAALGQERVVAGGVAPKPRDRLGRRGRARLVVDVCPGTGLGVRAGEASVRRRVRSANPRV